MGSPVNGGNLMSKKKLTAFMMTAVLMICGVFPVFAASNVTVQNTVNDTAEYLLNTVYDPQIGSAGGEWTVIGLARSGYAVPQSYFDNYYSNVISYVKSARGILDNTKYTEYSRVILALTAIGKDPSNVGGYNLLMPLGDYDKVIVQGLNGAVYALLALDSGNYDFPVINTGAKQATREMYIDYILSRQLSDGGFALAGNISDPDTTSMVLQVLAKYQDLLDVKTTTDKAISTLSAMQDSGGGFSNYGDGNLESDAQALNALCELGVSINDSRFVKNGNTVVDDLLTYCLPGGGFTHTDPADGADLMSTEQAFYSLVNLLRVAAGESSLYRMVEKSAEPEPLEAPQATETTSANGMPPNELPTGLPGKNRDVKALPVIYPGKTFHDIISHKDRAAIEALAYRGIISGINDTTYAPDTNMTRAQFATIVVRDLGLTAKTTGRFKDVPANNSYAAYIDTAYSYGIVSGVSPDTFAPDQTITKQEAAVMVSNAAKLCGMETTLSTAEIRDTLAQFADYTATADWARNGLAICYKSGILCQTDLKINPIKPVTRADIAEMLYLMLTAANLI